ncbi:hypothetical protein DW083_13545 [Parabacteroides sp. AF48-14]|uniref:hypothetical protein n=1 Tax=Parabacteroides sp. AF48-14 TaxID=2292052 RepID=UPI000F00CDA2|nr:hypothetical protein [Parabacteroides sp. AF48-14]RHO70402.1 hypothetical protein DW083_13545 [Parabacteroides sp. AF48-14]
MKLKNILSILCVFFIATACSMEDDIIQNDFGKNNEAFSDGNVHLSFTLQGGTATTKSSATGNPATEEIAATEAISTCSVILFKGDDVLAVRDGVAVTNNTTLPTDFSILTKEQTGLHVMIVANSTISFANYSDMDAVKAAVQTTTGFADGTLVKVGTAAINFSDKSAAANVNYAASTSTAKTETNTYTQAVTVYQLAARIELAHFNVTYDTNSESADVIIKSVRLLNSNLSSKTGIGAEKVVAGNYNVEETNNYQNTPSLLSNYTVYTNKVATDLENPVVFYSYKNTNQTAITVSDERYEEGINEDNLTKVEIKFTVGTEEYTKAYVINRPGDDNTTGTTYVNPNYIYRLTVKMKVTNRKVDCAVVCYTRDWQNNEIEVNL